MKNMFSSFIKNNELIVNSNDWLNIVSKYSKDSIIKNLSDAIDLYEIKLPYREISIDDMVNDFNRLDNINTDSIIKDGKWVSKFDYSYEFIDKYIDLSNIGNKSSDFFHQTERWKCDATGYPSPQKTWDNERFRLTLFKALFSLKVKEINPQILRNVISLRKYIASQFRPSAAKAIYDYFKSERVLDFSMGWGDRLAGAHTSEFVKRYVGIEPNINLIGNYVRQIKTYNDLNNNDKSYKFHYGCAEDNQIVTNEPFDLIFTSPPYFDKEKYDQSENQSYKKYKNFDSWMKNFLFKSIDLRAETLKSGGYLVINISDIYTRKKRYRICDIMNDYIMKTKRFNYIGAMGLRMPKRPMSISSETIGVYGEPIWIYCKK